MPYRTVDGSCVRLRPEHRNHVWSHDFVLHRTDDGEAFLAIRKLNSTEVIGALMGLFILRRTSTYVRSDNGPEFIVPMEPKANPALTFKLDHSGGANQGVGLPEKVRHIYRSFARRKPHHKTKIKKGPERNLGGCGYYYFLVLVIARQSSGGGLSNRLWARAIIATEAGSPFRFRSATSNAARASSNRPAR